MSANKLIHILDTLFRLLFLTNTTCDPTSVIIENYTILSIGSN